MIQTLVHTVKRPTTNLTDVSLDQVVRANKQNTLTQPLRWNSHQTKMNQSQQLVQLHSSRSNQLHFSHINI